MLPIDSEADYNVRTLVGSSTLGKPLTVNARVVQRIATDVAINKTNQ